jgi:hypothetical protein
VLTVARSGAWGVSTARTQGEAIAGALRQCHGRSAEHSDGGKLIVSIKNSSVQSWNGTDRVLTLAFSGRTVTGTSAPFKNAVGSGDVVAVTVWERIE